MASKFCLRLADLNQGSNHHRSEFVNDYDDDENVFLTQFRSMPSNIFDLHCHLGSGEIAL